MTPKNIYSAEIWAVLAYFKISTPRGGSRVLTPQCLFSDYKQHVNPNLLEIDPRVCMRTYARSHPVLIVRY